MNVALDIGAYEMRSLWYRGGKLRSRRCRSLYLAVEDSAAQRDKLRRLNQPFTVLDENLIVVGDRAERAAASLGRSVSRLLPDGRIPDEDRLARRLLAAIIQSLIGQSDRRHNLCAYVLPGAVKSGPSLEGAEKEYLTDVIRQLGYEPLLVTGPQSVVLANPSQPLFAKGRLGGGDFTGIGMTFGAATAEIGLVHRGVEICGRVVTYAGDWIDRRLVRANALSTIDSAATTPVDTRRVREWKETFDRPLLEPAGAAEQQLADLCTGMIEQLLHQAGTAFKQAFTRAGLDDPITVSVAGGTARLPGFRALIEQSLETSDFPIPIRDVCMATESAHLVVRGCLIHAERESEAIRRNARTAA